MFYPYLNLLINPIETSLKALIEFADEHRLATNGRCQSFSESQSIKTLGTHNIKKLVNVAKEIMRDADEFHRLPEMENTFNLFSGLYDLGVTSESTRYTKDRENKTLKFYQKQIYIDPERLHNEIHEKCHTLISFIESAKLHLCRVDEFSERREGEIGNSINLMKKYKSSFVQPILNNSNLSSEIKFETVKQILKRGIDPKIEQWHKDLKAALDCLDDKSLASIDMGLYFVRNPVTVPDLDFFVDQTRTELIKSIMRRCHLFVSALEQLEKHLIYIQEARRVARKQ